ncbi:MAG: hypothetical protein AAGA60_19275 [Cyanobacteria bacterium P01_E01_bin.42]
MVTAYSGKNFNTSFVSPSVDSQDKGVRLQQVYETLPDLKQCREGIVKESEKQKILNRVNFIRSLHELPLVRYQDNTSHYNAKAALIYAANNSQNEKELPQDRQKCWSEAGDKGLKNSMGYSVFSSRVDSTSLWVESEHFVDALFQDSRRNGLRRRELLLNPFLNSISFGRADGFPDYRDTKVLTYDEEEIETQVNRTTSVALEVIADRENSQTPKQNFIAYPYQDYPAELFQKDEYIRGYPPMSFAAIADPNNPQNNQNIDFSIAVIEIRDRQNDLLPVDSIKIEKSSIGLEQILSWKVDDLQYNQRYNVNINNVKVNNRPINYTYWFEIKSDRLFPQN